MKDKTVHVWTSTYAAADRVLVRPEREAELTVEASDLPLSCYLPTLEDMLQRRQRMEIVVQRILVSHLDCFSDCLSPPNIEHQHSDELAKKSDVVSVGIIPCNPGSKEGCFTVLDSLHQYVPHSTNANLDDVVFHGDAGSVTGMLSAKQARAGCMTKTERLQRVCPVPGEFHRRMLLNQDSMNILYQADSKGDRGTLANVKSAFQLKAVKPKVTECFNAVEDAFNLTTKGLVCLTAMELLKMKEPDAVMNISDEARQQTLEEIARKVVTFFWHQTPLTDVMNAVEADIPGSTDKFCICQEKSGMI